MLTEDQYEAFGVLHKILPEGKFVAHGKENKTKVFSIKTSTRERREISFTLYNSAIEKLAHLQPGAPVRVVFELESKFTNEKYFSNIKCINLIPLEKEKKFAK